MPVEIYLYKNENGNNTAKVTCDYCKKPIHDFGDGTAYWKAHQGKAGACFYHRKKCARRRLFIRSGPIRNESLKKYFKDFDSVYPKGYVGKN